MVCHAKDIETINLEDGLLVAQMKQCCSLLNAAKDQILVRSIVSLGQQVGCNVNDHGIANRLGCIEQGHGEGGSEPGQCTNQAVSSWQWQRCCQCCCLAWFHMCLPASHCLELRQRSLNRGTWPWRSTVHCLDLRFDPRAS